MDQSKYQDYLKAKELGLKGEAKVAIEDFVASFSDFETKERWVFRILPDIDRESNGRIRHELYAEVIFPVLFNGYQSNDIEALLWLGLTEQNLLQAKSLLAKLNGRAPEDLLFEALELSPSDPRIQAAVFDVLMRRLEWVFHEWPDCICHPDAWPEIKEEMALAQSLDAKNALADRIAEMHKQMQIWEQQSRKAHSPEAP